MNKNLFLIASLCFCSASYAGGYRVALQGQIATGMGHTGVAVTGNPEIVFFNPAGIPYLEKDNSLASGVTLIDSVIKYQNTATSTAAETDNPLGTPAYAYLSKKFTPDFALGFGFYTPYGNSVEWEKDWAGSHLVNNISLRTLFFQPTVAYKFSDVVSIGIGPSLVVGSVEFNRNLSTSLADSNGDRANVTINADNILSWGYNIGIIVRPVKPLSLGLSYRAKVELTASGENADFANIPTSMATAFPDTTFDADLVLPAELTIGLSFDIGNRTTIAMDINRTFWSAYENLNVNFDNSAGLSANPRNYNDANIYRAGVTHQLLPNIAIRVGGYYDESPISPGYFTPETARNDSIGLTAGASFTIAKGFDVDVSYLYLLFKEFNGSYDHYDQSGTTISFGGDYLSSVQAFGLGLNYQF